MNTYYLINTSVSPPTPLYQGDGTLQYQRRAHSFKQANAALPADRAYVPLGQRVPYDADTQELRRAEHPTETEWPWVVVDLSPELVEAKANAKRVKTVERDPLISALFVLKHHLTGVHDPITAEDIVDLLEGGIAQAEAALAAAEGEEAIAAATLKLTEAQLGLLRFNNATSFNYNHPLVISLASILGVSVDQVFNLANKFKNPTFDYFAPEPDPNDEVI